MPRPIIWIDGNIAGFSLFKHQQRYTVLIDAADIAAVSRCSWNINLYGAAQRPRVVSTASRKERRKKEYLHRFLMGALCAGREVDHINRSALDNRRHNLRICSHRENMHNISGHRGTYSGVRGVYRTFPTKADQPATWYARVHVDGRYHFAGFNFVSIDEAAQAVLELRKRLGVHVGVSCLGV